MHANNKHNYLPFSLTPPNYNTVKAKKKEKKNAYTPQFCCDLYPIKSENNTISVVPLMKWIHVRNHLCSAHSWTAAGNQRQENAGRRKQWMWMHSHLRIDGHWLERLSDEHLVWETPKSVEPSVTLPLDLDSATKRPSTIHYIRHNCSGKVCTKELVRAAEVVSERETEGRADLQYVRQQGQPIPGGVLAF